MKFRSLSFRLLLTASLMLLIFFALVTIILEQAYRDSAELALQEQLRVHVYALLSAADIDPAGKVMMPGQLHEPRFANPGSGLHAYIRGNDANMIWRSASSMGMNPPEWAALAPGAKKFMLDDSGHFVFQYSVIWENEFGLERALVFTVVEDSRSLITQVDSFRTTLTYWLLLSGVLLVIIQFIVLRWGLKPLRKIAKDLEAIEQGSKTSLEGQYPSELQGLAGNLNALVNSERAHLERYRNTLADLAHSLKTPLTILRGGLNSKDFPVDLQGGFETQISRMNEIVEYQLQRAAAKGKLQLTGKVDAVLVIKKIIASLAKVHQQKDIKFILDLPDSYWIYCEAGDLYEIFGNLLDNASKWCQQRVKVMLSVAKEPGELLLLIEDDGPGIPLHKIDMVLQRGIRADENIQGHGIGMAVVNDLVKLLGGSLSGSQSASLGGMKWQVKLQLESAVVKR